MGALRQLESCFCLSINIEVRQILYSGACLSDMLAGWKICDELLELHHRACGLDFVPTDLSGDVCICLGGLRRRRLTANKFADSLFPKICRDQNTQAAEP